MKNKDRITEVKHSFISNKIIRWGLIPFALILLWLVLSLLYSSYRSFTVLQYPHSKNEITNLGGERLFKGGKIAGKFTARENNLGIISLRIGDVQRVEFEKEDLLVFKIKEAGAEEWLYENNYRSGSILPNQFHPFGFNQINDSLNKEYIFELSSLRGDAYNAIEIDHANPLYLSKYKFSREEIFENAESVREFLTKKVITFLTNWDSLISSIIFILPLLFYILWITLPVNNWVKSSGILTAPKIFAITVSVIIILDSVLYESFILGIVMGLVGLWTYSVYVNKFKSSVTFLLSFILIMISVGSIYFKQNISLDKSTTFAYLFLVIGFLQSVIEVRKERLIQKRF